MRCALRYDEELSFVDQKVEAWGEMQSMSEEPSYKEIELDEENAVIFTAYKMAMDDAVSNYEATAEIYDADVNVEGFKSLCAGSICELLFSLLDGQEENEDE